MRFIKTSQRAAKRRSEHEVRGTHVPPFLIASITGNCNLVPIISIEGDETETDSRRGQGVYKQAADAMHHLRERKLLYGASITVTSGNLDIVTDSTFATELAQAGCVLFEQEEAVARLARS